MHVLFVTHNPNMGSSARPLQGWCLRGPQLGVTPSVCIQQRGYLSEWLDGQRIPYVINPMPWPDRFRPSSLWHAWRLARFARRRRIDLIHCNEHDRYPFAALVAHWSGRPVVCFVRCKIDSGFARWAFGKRPPEALVWATANMREECQSALGGTVCITRQHIIPGGVDLGRYGQLADRREELRREWGVENGRLVVGMVGALVPGKRVEDYLELATRLSGSRPRPLFVLAGRAKPGEEAYAASLRRRLDGAGDDFRYVGYLEPLEPFYHAIDICVSTSEHESFGQSICEAMACRRPIAAYRACSVEEVVGDGGVTVATGDVDGLEVALRRLVDDGAFREHCGRLARERVAEKFDVNRTLAQLKHVYEEVLERWQQRKS
jgi:L-malate glycosyltransferase